MGKKETKRKREGGKGEKGNKLFITNSLQGVLLNGKLFRGCLAQPPLPRAFSGRLSLGKLGGTSFITDEVPRIMYKRRAVGSGVCRVRRSATKVRKFKPSPR